MSRLDVRVRTDLPARINYSAGTEKREEVVQLKELSLRGGMLVGFSGTPGDQFLVSLTQLSCGELELCAETVRTGRGWVAARFYYRSNGAMSALWPHIRERLTEDGSCPYCGHDAAPLNGRCGGCSCCLEFKDAGYLEKHLKTTLSARIGLKMGRLDMVCLQKVMNVIDCEMMHLDEATDDEDFVGTSTSMLKVFSMIRKAAGTDMNILVLGESGTGKELTARAIHERSGRRHKPLVALNCAAIPEGLLEAELFGYEKGSFTGAYATKKGKFESADGGTIFLDEIGDLSPALQAKLLRFLEDRVVERIGGKTGKKVDVRIVAATNCDLESMVDKGTFRTDLFFRLNSLRIGLPPLRERCDDKLILAKYFLKKIGRAEGTALKGFSVEAASAIMGYDWPGNVRELINKVRRGLVMADGAYIEPSDMELPDRPVVAVAATGNDTPVGLQREAVLAVLERYHYVISQAATELRISRPTLYALMKRHDIQAPPKR